MILGIWGCRLEGDIGINFTHVICESVERIKVGHDMTHWQVAANKVVHHQVP